MPDLPNHISAICPLFPGAGKHGNNLWYDVPGGWLPGGWDGRYSAVPTSCPRPLRHQERIHPDRAARDVTQPIGEPKGSLPATGEDVAQVRVGALSGLGKLFEGPAISFGPAEHRMF